MLAHAGGTLAHAGIGLTVLGIVATSAWQSERVVAMKPGDSTEIAGYALALRGIRDLLAAKK